jgi:hypothetical protein
MKRLGAERPRLIGGHRLAPADDPVARSGSAHQPVDAVAVRYEKPEIVHAEPLVDSSATFEPVAATEARRQSRDDGHGQTDREQPECGPD